MDAFLSCLGRNRLRLGIYIFHSASNRLPLTPGNVYRVWDMFLQGSCFISQHYINLIGLALQVSVFPAEVTAAETHRLSQKFQNRTNASKNLVFFIQKSFFGFFFISSRRKNFPFDATSCESEFEASIIVQLKAAKFWYKKVKSKISQKLQNGSFLDLEIKKQIHFTLCLHASVVTMELGLNQAH